MKYTVLGFQQEKLLKYGLDVSDALILSTIKDMYSTASMEFIQENNIKYMWINYTYLQKQIPIAGTKRNIMRRIKKYGDELFLLRILKYERNNIKGKFSYVAPTKKLDSLQDFDLMTKSHKGYDNLSQPLMTKSHNKDHTLYIDPSIKDPKPLVQELEIEFEKFWEMYEKKNNRKKAFQKWKKLKQEDKDKIFKTLPEYVKSTPDVKFRKNPVTYLNNESWNDEIVYREDKDKQPNKTNIFDCL